MIFDIMIILVLVVLTLLPYPAQIYIVRNMAALLLVTAIVWAAWHNSRDRHEIIPPAVKRDKDKPWR